jgi:hypothetical protein
MNNLKTVLTNNRSSYWLGHFDCEQAAAEQVAFCFAEIEAEIEGLSREQVEEGLRAMFLDGEDIGDLEYLANRFGIDLEEVIGRQEVPVICEKTQNGNAQMAFHWEV